MGKQIHTENSHQIRKSPVEFGPQVQKAEDQHRNPCCLNLNLDRIRTGPNKGLDLEVLLQRFEKQLNLPQIKRMAYCFKIIFGKEFCFP